MRRGDQFIQLVVGNSRDADVRGNQDCQQRLGQLGNLGDPIGQSSDGVFKAIAHQPPIPKVPIAILIQMMKADQQTMAGLTGDFVLVLLT